VTRLLLAAGLLAALALPPAANARAAAGVAAHHVEVDRLRFAGGRLLLASQVGSRSETIDAVAAGRAPRRLALLRAGPPGACTGDQGDMGVDFGFDASPQALAASSVCSSTGAATITRVFAVAAGQAPVQLAGCSPPGLLRPPVAVTGTRVAYVDDCAPPGASLVVHDLAGGPDRRFALPADPQQYFGTTEALQAAGPFLAYDLSSDAQPASSELDLRTGAQRALPVAGDATLTDLAVDTAGRVLARRDADGSCGTIELYAPGAPAAGVLEPCADDSGIALANGVPAYFAAGRLHVGDRVVAQLPAKISAAHLAFDGRRAAFDIPECGGRRDVVRVDVNGPPWAGARLTCPFSVPPQQPRLKGSQITVRARCPRGCADADMLLLSADRHRRALAVYTRAADPGAAQGLTIGARAARTIRRRGHLDAILRVGVRRLDTRYRFRERRVTIVAG
jgi:hypothetical protein